MGSPRVLILVAGACVALALCALPYRTPFAVHADSVAGVVPGTSVGGIALGADINSVIARLGPVTQVRLAGTDGTLAYVFDPYGITAYVTNGVVVALTTTNSVLVDIEGIHIGTPVASLTNTLGTTSTAGAVEGMPGVALQLARARLRARARRGRRRDGVRAAHGSATAVGPRRAVRELSGGAGRGGDGRSDRPPPGRGPAAGRSG